MKYFFQNGLERESEHKKELSTFYKIKMQILKWICQYAICLLKTCSDHLTRVYFKQVAHIGSISAI